MAVTIATRPLTIDGCWSSWDEVQQPNTIRTEMEVPGVVKVRRRTTGISRIANVTRNFESKYYDDFMAWFNTACQGGVLPTRVKNPQTVEEVWRFTEPPKITWLTQKAFNVACVIEQLPIWRGL